MEKATREAIKKLKAGYSDKAIMTIVANYLEHGEPADLKKLIKAKITYGWDYGTLASALPKPDPEPGAEHLRVLIALLLTDNLSRCSEWIKTAVADGSTKLGDTLAAAGLPIGHIGATFSKVISGGKGTEVDGAGAWLLARSEKEIGGIAKAMKRLNEYGTPHAPLVKLLATHDAKRLEKKLLEHFLPKNGKVDWGVREALIESPSAALEKAGYAAFKACKDSNEKFHIAIALHNKNAKRYGADALDAARAGLRGSSGGNNHDQIGTWMLQSHGKKILPDLIEHCLRPMDKKMGWSHEGDRKAILDAAASALAAEATPLFIVATKSPNAAVRLSGMKHLIAFADPQYDSLIASTFEELAADKELGGEQIVPVISAVARWKPELIEETLWTLFKHKSKPARACAARALSAGGDAMIEKALPHLTAKSANPRLAAIILLSQIGSDKALAVLEARLDEEDNEDVRDQILLALEVAWDKQGRKQSVAELKARAKKALKKGISIPANLKGAPLKGIKLTDGTKLTEDQVRYLIFRQSRAKEMRPDVEAKPLLAMIDRSTSGALADEVLDRFLASKQDAKDRWYMALAAILGGNSLVPKLTKMIHEWPKKSRHKLSEYAVQALALINTDAALMAVDSMTIRYRSKYKNIGTAAAEAFREAAEIQGITADELGDRVVPRLGFPEGETTQILEGGGREIELSVGLDLKFRFRDLEKNKVIKTLPPALGAEHKAKMKERAATLREVVKAQNLRLENLLVRQYKWGSERWSELFVHHPLMKPFGARLLWASYSKQGELQKIFRALEDGTLTDADDNEVKLPKNSRIGLVHPLLLDKEQIDQWSEHLSDYEITPPFMQLERPLVRPSKDDLEQIFYTETENKSLGALTFKGRAERLGWNRGSVVDAGGISSYYKSFPNAGADVFVDVENMWIGMSYDDGDVTLGRAYFVKHGSVQIGSYLYDEPDKNEDERLLRFASVPPIVYSEAVSDLNRIVGETED